MDDQIVAGAFHEAGHALIAHIVRVEVKSIDLVFKGNTFQYGNTSYNSKEEIIGEWEFNQRIWYFLGGPVSQYFFERKDIKQISDLDKEHEDLFNQMCKSLSIDEKQEIFDQAIKVTTSLLKKRNNTLALNEIVNTLIEFHHISGKEFQAIVERFKVNQLDT